MFVLGTLQLTACFFCEEIHSKARCRLRTPCGEIPSVFVTKTSLANMILRDLLSFGKDWITQIILGKQNLVDKAVEKEEDLHKAA